MKKVIGIDLGSSNTIIYIPKKGVIYNEPTVVSINQATKKVESAGYIAFKLLGKAPETIKVIRPIQNGVVNDGPTTVAYLEAILKDLKLLSYVKKGTVIISCPSEFSQIEQTALRNVIRKIEAKNVIFKSQSYLACIGGNNSGALTKGNIVVTIGGGISDISVLTNGEVLLSKTSRFSGSVIDQTIIRHLRKNHHLIIGEKTAEYIKMKIGSVEAYPENRLLEVAGIDIVSSLPHSVIISTSEIRSALVNSIAPLVDDIIDCLELTPPEVASDIIESGLLICGGGALLSGIREYLENALNMSVRVTSDPNSTVTQGIKILAHQIINM